MFSISIRVGIIFQSSAKLYHWSFCTWLVEGVSQRNRSENFASPADKEDKYSRSYGHRIRSLHGIPGMLSSFTTNHVIGDIVGGRGVLPFPLFLFFVTGETEESPKRKASSCALQIKVTWSAGVVLCSTMKKRRISSDNVISY